MSSARRNNPATRSGMMILRAIIQGGVPPRASLETTVGQSAWEGIGKSYCCGCFYVCQLSFSLQLRSRYNIYIIYTYFLHIPHVLQ